MKKSMAIMVSALLLVSTVFLPLYAKAEQGEAGDRVDISTQPFSEEDAPQYFIAYVYVENNMDNPYNNPNRDITLNFGGSCDYYLTAKNAVFASDYAYETYGVARITGYLPQNGEVSLNLYPTTSDTNVSTLAYKEWFFDEEITASTPLEIREEYNEFFLVAGSSDWVQAEGENKLRDLYRLFHSETGDVNDNTAYQIAINAELFAYWEQQMNADPSIEAFQTQDGTTYTREDMQNLGYAVSLDKEGASDKTEDSDKTEEVEETEDIDNTQQDTEESITVPSEKKEGFSIPPLFVIIVAAILVAGAVAIAFIKKERNHSDLYVD